ncbi:SAV_915 family protein [Streptomyces desertarenae]|uniref:SAV_915 family protein n=1 Tax=Streptomyces desertarenae TaxID=2666184 RepID=A0ABW4PRB7_9ACTN
MADVLRGGVSEPGERGGAGLLYIPVRPGPRGCVTRLFRTPRGQRTAVAFTTPARLTAILGPEHPWIRLSVSALRSLTAPLGCTAITVDPQVVGAAGRQPLRKRSRARAGSRAATRPDRPWRVRCRRRAALRERAAGAR